MNINSNITIYDKILSFFIGIVIVFIFINLFESQCIVVIGPPINNLNKTIIKNKQKNTCSKLNLIKTPCLCRNI